MLKHLLYFSTLSIFWGCSSSPTTMPEGRKIHDNNQAAQITLSHVKAYLRIGNIKKAEERYKAIDAPENLPETKLVLAELLAVKGKGTEAQEVFLSALTDNQYDVILNHANVPTNLLDYFCEEKKWPALKGYGKAVIASADYDNSTLDEQAQIKNNALSKIGVCFFYQQHWSDAKYWLEQLDLTKQVNPLVYLALARANIELQQYSNAQDLITQYEQKKDAIDAQTLWVTIEVYMALKQPEKANKIGKNLRSLFPNNEYTRKYIIATKRSERIARRQQYAVASQQTGNGSPPQAAVKASAAEKPFHIIKKGETLYQLSKRYGVSIGDLLKWNPNLVVDNIALGTSIRLSAN